MPDFPLKITKLDSKYSGADLSPRLQEVLDLQKTLLAKRDSTGNERGFLISEFQESELRSLLEDSGELYLGTINGQLAGYCLTTPIQELSNLVLNPELGRFDLDSPAFNDTRGCRYIYQIGTSNPHGRLGIGSRLLVEVRSQEPEKALYTDVLTSPLNNEASIRFFERNGFKRIGFLTLAAYRDFGELKSVVLKWN